MADIPTMTGIFFDPATGRIYYTLSGQSSLFYRSFLPESHVIGAIRSTATGDIAAPQPESGARHVPRSAASSGSATTPRATC